MADKLDITMWLTTPVGEIVPDPRVLVDEKSEEDIIREFALVLWYVLPSGGLTELAWHLAEKHGVNKAEMINDVYDWLQNKKDDV